MLDLERAKTAEFEEKMKRALADYDNLCRKTESDIKDGIRAKVDEFVLDFLKIHDDFVRAIDVFAENGVDTEGLDSILKNMDLTLKNMAYPRLTHSARSLIRTSTRPYLWWMIRIWMTAPS